MTKKDKKQAFRSSDSFRCGLTGHFIRECPANNEGNKKNHDFSAVDKALSKASGIIGKECHTTSSEQGGQTNQLRILQREPSASEPNSSNQHHQKKESETIQRNEKTANNSKVESSAKTKDRKSLAVDSKKVEKRDLDSRDRKRRSHRSKEKLTEYSNGITLPEGSPNVTAFNTSKNNIFLISPSSKKQAVPVEDTSVVAWLALEGTVVMQRKNNRFPDAVYFCTYCDYHINSVDHAKRHFKHADHVKAKDQNLQDKTAKELLQCIPEPVSAHCDALQSFVEHISETYGRPVDDLNACQRFANDLSKIFQKEIDPECNVKVYGSCQTGFALKHSDLNLELTFPEHIGHAKALKSAEQVLRKREDLVSELNADYCARWPFVSFRPKDFSFIVECVLSVRNSQAYDVGCLLKVYTDFEPRIVKLGQVWRFWAKTCALDDFSTGGLPPYAFDLMLIHYLQQLPEQILPCLHELNNNQSNGKDMPQSALGKAGSCTYPTVPHVPTVVTEEDSEEVSLAETSAMEDTVDDEQLTVQNSDDNDGNLDYERSIESVKKLFTSPSELNLGKLWINLFRFYVVGHDNQASVVCIRQLKKLSRTEKGWNRKRIAIEDPFLPKKNLANMSAKMYDYFSSCLHRSFIYYAIPQTSDRPLIDFINGQPTLNLPEDSKLAAKKNSQNQQSFSRQRAGHDNEAKNGTQQQANILASKLAEMAINVDTEDQREAAQGGCEHQRHTAQDCTIEEAASHQNQHEIPDTKPKENAACSYFTNDVKEQLTAEFSNEKIDKLESLQYSRNECLTLAGPYLAKAAECVVSKDYLLLNIVTKKGVGSKQVAKLLKENKKHKRNLRKFSAELASGIVAASFEELFPGATGVHCFTSVHLSPNKTSTPKKRPCHDVVEPRNDKLVRICNVETVTVYNGEIVPNNKENVPSCNGDEPPVFEQRVKDLFERAICLEVEDFLFKMDQGILSGGKKPVLMCPLCNQEGHTRKDCPEDRLPLLIRLPKPNENVRNIMNMFLKDVADYYLMRHDSTVIRENIRSYLLQVLRSEWPTAELTLFGSSVNGFGFHDSDVDMCFHLGNSDTLPLGMDPVRTIKRIARILSRVYQISRIIPVTQAKVPIVKCHSKAWGLEVDISLYNTLAIRNTELMRAYAVLDPRVTPLGVLLKIFARYSNIGDASQGSLSSYAYLQMLIYYLQQCDPPVLPVLQEMTCDNCGPNDPHNPRFRVEGYNTYFYPLGRLKQKKDKSAKAWFQSQKNDLSLFDLLLGFFRFYTEKFSFAKHVVCIRRKEPMTKFEKLWTDRPMAIEDPFELCHNLGSGVRQKMYIYILTAFTRARCVIGTLQLESGSWNTAELESGYGKNRSKHPRCMHRYCAGTHPRNYHILEQWFFDNMMRPKQPPPMDNLCRICHHIGHFAETCPNSRKNRNRRLSSDSEDEKNETSPTKTTQNVQIEHGTGEQQVFVVDGVGGLVLDKQQHKNTNTIASQQRHRKNTVDESMLLSGCFEDRRKSNSRKVTRSKTISNSSAVQNLENSFSLQLDNTEEFPQLNAAEESSVVNDGAYGVAPLQSFRWSQHAAAASNVNSEPMPTNVSSTNASFDSGFQMHQQEQANFNQSQQPWPVPVPFNNQWQQHGVIDPNFYAQVSPHSFQEQQYQFQPQQHSFVPQPQQVATLIGADGRPLMFNLGGVQQSSAIAAPVAALMQSSDMVSYHQQQQVRYHQPQQFLPNASFHMGGPGPLHNVQFMQNPMLAPPPPHVSLACYGNITVNVIDPATKQPNWSHYASEVPVDPAPRTDQRPQN